MNAKLRSISRGTNYELLKRGTRKPVDFTICQLMKLIKHINYSKTDYVNFIKLKSRIQKELPTVICCFQIKTK